MCDSCFIGYIRETFAVAGINVPRSRFLPVKKTSDLMLVMSNLYTLRNGSLVMSPQRMFPTTPLIKLGDNHFSKVRTNLSCVSCAWSFVNLYKFYPGEIHIIYNKKCIYICFVNIC